ncbi:tyrosine-type recombinase/integrase [Rhizobium leguminosarum]|uniref:tyrosine-type recombinase/integrase n=1 Tax=Rhizobium leguminosarum TaxID=384 RepID=UPI0003FD39E0|nr:site-specific integrase [Rhizobium leguminosarum]NEI61406.1 integrase arm-type DNA-binding domain-containing protein [Rhizobium leguminosarum]
MAKKKLTDLGVEALKKSGARYDVMDAHTPGFGVRVGTSGKKTFILYTRYPGSSAPTRRELGEYPVMSLAEARDKAHEWHKLIKKGIDPRDAEERERAEQARKRVNTFEAVGEDYIAYLPSRDRNRHSEQDEREIRRELLDPKRNRWVKKPVSEITDTEIGELIAAIRDRPAPGQAYNALGHVKSIFSWAMWPERRAGYGLKENPTRDMAPKHFGLAKTVRTRVFTDDEIVAYWSATYRMKGPLGPYFRALMLTGQRKDEVSGARRREFDFGGAIWTVPEERFKSGVDHLVPMTQVFAKLIEAMPKHNKGDFVFSFSAGEKAINGFSRAKQALHDAMLAELQRTDEGAELPAWTLHDVRRTVRTRLSGLRVNADVAEMVIGHGKKGLERVYNQHTYADEMRDALMKWEAALRRLRILPKLDRFRAKRMPLEPDEPASNVVVLRAS